MPWWTHLRGRPFYHPLDDEHPPARVFMLRRLIGRERPSRVLREAQNALCAWPWGRAQIARLPDEQTPPPATPIWEPRYTAPLWRLRLLAEFEMRCYDEHLAAATDWLLTNAPPPDAIPDDAPINLNALVLSVPLAFGFESDERVQMRLAHLFTTLRQRAWPQSPAERADWLAQAAYVLTWLATPPADLVALVADALLALDAHVPSRWRRFGAPIFDQPDLLFATRVLLELGVRDARLGAWVAAIEAAQHADARAGWYLAASRYEAAAAPLEAEGAFSRWLTAQAIYVLNAWYGDA
ncbi:hypothetical protein ARMA_0761 [Ardenticatena maritima]|uniref:Uncharacterized protein n=1 Tax=Ardenticatena maritima TaxID=872965 RepID=A0A0M9UBY2_9CHLR|nr:hypothetical protein [Ardenticatena maritima]KPL87300.1 hypothetical protein SE16_12495 [Ardenticatena maritima]GAP62338.1 hypothetical protein ARMA_0761 [Ardenticatena maritima]